ncbi:protein PHLOEM PROTEIN 2-LIKE A10-like [Corylus avellana]|uniref:protein PHLOEM PROTEIN 2-LIKE A10-like n=1 Tax=Corylus avellana TaxID=13451 RepID=UPI001E220C40|nr:protein PHLOEM PROTEIN 2-LIKE A10-like [Corylus avellana]
MMDLQLVKTGFHFASKRRKLVLLLSAFGFTGYSLYTVYHLPSVAHKRERISKLFTAFVSVAEAVSASAESIGVVSEDLKQFLQSDSDKVPNSLKQISKIASSDDFSRSLTRLTQALTVGILRGYRSAGVSVAGGDNCANSSSFTDQAMDKLFSTAGSGFASAVVGSFARNLVMAFYSNNSTNFEHVDPETNDIPQWVNMIFGDKCRELIADCIQLFVSTAVAVYLDKTMNINFYDDLLSGLTNPKHEMKAREMLVSVCNGAVETLVKTCYDSGMNSSPGPTGKGSTPAKIEDDCLKPSEKKDRGWVDGVSSTLAVPSNKRFVLDVTGRVTFETVRSFLELLLEKLYEGLKRCLQIVHEAVVDGGVEVVRFATAKSSVAATLCLSLCLHILEGPWILVPA